MDTNTYPLTKNIKAELAGVVIIAVFGVVSQMRVWKLVKEHRAKSAAQQLEKQQDQDREEEALGRKIEDRFQKERVQWEAAYGGRSIQDSSIRSSTTSPKGSTSIRETEVYGHDSLEMVSMSKSGVTRSNNVDTPAGTTVTVSLLNHDDIQQIDAQGNPINNEQTNAPKAAPSPVPQPTVTNNSSVHPSVSPPPPAVVPLPFTVPQGEDAVSEEEDNASVSALAETNHETENILRPMSKRISDMSAMRHRTPHDISESQEALITIPSLDDDRASSVAATLDDDMDDISFGKLSPPHSFTVAEHETLLGASSIARATSENVEKDTSPQGEPASNSPWDSSTLKKDAEQGGLTSKDAKHIVLSRPTVRNSLTASTDPKLDEPQAKRLSLRDPRIRVDTPISNTKASSEGEQSKSTRSDALSQGSQTELAEPYGATLKERVLPQKLSKVALSYRTNEWAKHLEAADKPDLDELPDLALAGVIPEEGPEEQPAPVSEEIASPLLGSKIASRRTSAESRAYRNSGSGLHRSASKLSQESLVDQQVMTRSPPVVSSGVRSRSNSGTRLDALSPLPTNTLLGQREKLMKNRTSSQSLTPYTSSANLSLEQSEQENMTLAQRRQLLQQAPPSLPQNQAPMTSQRNTPPSASHKWAKKGWAAKGVPAGFDSHQPKRTSSSQSDQKREQLYAGWRDKMRDVTPPQTAAHIAEQQRLALLNERRQKEIDKQQRELMQQQRASQIDSMMRSGHMLDAHREAMRKMQANANKHA